LFVSNYVTLNVLDTIKRVPGTTNVQIFWREGLRHAHLAAPDRMTQLKLTTADLLRALNEQNAQFRRRQSRPGPTAVRRNWSTPSRPRGGWPIHASSKKSSSARTRMDPALRLKDVARVELASKDYDFIGASTAGNRRCSAFSCNLEPTRSTLQRMSARPWRKFPSAFPVGMNTRTLYDTTRFVQVSIREVVKTLLEAMALVFLVVFCSCKTGRATLIPFAAVPVSLIGTFAGLFLHRLFDQHAYPVRHGAGHRQSSVAMPSLVLEERRTHHARGAQGTHGEAAIKAMTEVNRSGDSYRTEDAVRGIRADRISWED
jgi:multidrug efflux pump subunit AcrB